MSNWDEKLRLIEGKTTRLTEQYAQLWRLNKEQEEHIRQLEAENLALRQALQQGGLKPAAEAFPGLLEAEHSSDALPSYLSTQLKHYIQQLDKAIHWIEES